MPHSMFSSLRIEISKSPESASPPICLSSFTKSSFVCYCWTCGSSLKCYKFCFWTNNHSGDAWEHVTLLPSSPFIDLAYHNGTVLHLRFSGWADTLFAFPSSARILWTAPASFAWIAHTVSPSASWQYERLKGIRSIGIWIKKKSSVNHEAMSFGSSQWELWKVPHLNGPAGNVAFSNRKSLLTSSLLSGASLRGFLFCRKICNWRDDESHANQRAGRGTRWFVTSLKSVTFAWAEWTTCCQSGFQRL